MAILISVYDAKASAFGAPQPFDNITVALRAYLTFARQKPEAMQVAFAEDFSLYEVGAFNPVSGLVVATVPPAYLESMVNLVNIVRKEVSNG